jgi:hypothetical protein
MFWPRLLGPCTHSKNAQEEAAALPVSKNNIYQLTLKVRVACKFDAHSFIVECVSQDSSSVLPLAVWGKETRN